MKVFDTNTVRLAGAPHKKAFIKAPMNMLGTRIMENQLKNKLESLIIVITDSFAIAPYYIGLVMEAPPPELSPVVSTNQTNLPTKLK